MLIIDFYREAWHAAIHGVAKSWTRLSDWSDLISMLNILSRYPFLTCTVSDEKSAVNLSSVLRKWPAFWMLLNLSPCLSISFSGSQCLIMLCLSAVFLISLMHGIHWAYLRGSLNLWFSQAWATSPNMSFLSLHPSHSFRDSNYRYIKLLEVVPEITGSMLTFPPHDYSFFCFILDNFYYYFIMVSDLVSVCVGAMSNLLLMTFSALCLGDYRFLSPEFLFWSLICLPCFSLNFLNLSLSAASNICISSVLVSVDWFPPSFYIVFLRFLYIIQLGWTSLYSWALFWNTVKLLGNCLIPLSLIFKVC